MVSNVTALAFILNILSESLPKTKNVPYLGNNFLKIYKILNFSPKCLHRFIVDFGSISDFYD